MPIDRVTQLEQALAAARELLSDTRRRHEAAEKMWAAHNEQLQRRIDWLETRLAGDVVQKSKGVGVH